MWVRVLDALQQSSIGPQTVEVETNGIIPIDFAGPLFSVAMDNCSVRAPHWKRKLSAELESQI